MATYPKSGSILDSTVHTSLSTQIVIMVNNEPVGAVQSLQIEQNRPTVRVGEVGFDGTIEIVPNAKTEITLNIERIVYDGLSVTEAFSRGFQNIQAQRIPFDIVVIDQFSGTGDDATITTFVNCWFESLSKPYRAEQYIITENCRVAVETIKTLRGGEAVALSQGVGGGRQLAGTQFDDVELAADSGSRRGSLDFPGLISASF